MGDSFTRYETLKGDNDLYHLKADVFRSKPCIAILGPYHIWPLYNLPRVKRIESLMYRGILMVDTLVASLKKTSARDWLKLNDLGR